MRRPPKAVWWTAIAVVGVFAVAIVWFLLSAYPLGGSGRTVIIKVTPGESVNKLGSDLAGHGVISSAFAFHLDTMLFGSPHISPGYFAVATNSSFSSVKAVFSASPNASVLRVNPGLTIQEVAQDLSALTSPTYASKFLAATHALTSSSSFRPQRGLEGLIGSGTYVLNPSDSPRQLVERMTQRFLTQAAHQGIVPGRSIHGLSAYQLVIAASIVEKEGYYPKNMPGVARVILNRLARHAGLQMDSTILYALHLDGGTVTPAMLRIHSPYNTYLNPGLTPTPICVVSEDALAAINHPPRGNWYYFTLVSKDGTEAFAATFSQQLANERLAASRGV